MDRKTVQNPEILRLAARSEAARNTLGQEAAKLRHQLDLAGRLRISLRSKLGTWLLGSSIAGLAAGMLFPRFRRKVPSAPSPHGGSMTMRTLGMVWSAAQPFVKMWLTNQVQSWMTQRAMSHAAPPSPRNPPR